MLHPELLSEVKTIVLQITLKELQTSMNPGSYFSRRVQQERADSPGPSLVSMKSDRSIGIPPDMTDGRPSREKR